MVYILRIFKLAGAASGDRITIRLGRLETNIHQDARIVFLLS